MTRKNLECNGILNARYDGEDENEWRREWEEEELKSYLIDCELMLECDVASSSASLIFSRNFYTGAPVSAGSSPYSRREM